MSQTERGVGIDTRKSPPTSSGRKFLFGIGIKSYKHCNELKNAVKDLDDIVNLLVDRYDFERENVTLLLNEEATFNRIINRLHSFTDPTKLGSSDSLLIYFSGHGYLDNNKDGYWVPVEAESDDIASLIPNETVLSKIRKMKCRHVLLISDSCFSGSLLLEERSVAPRNRIADELERKESRWIITSGRPDEKVLDATYTNGKNSPFAASMLSELRNNTKAKLLTDALALHVRENTSSNALQIPQFGKLYGSGDMGGRFVFNLRNREADDWQSALAQNTVPAFETFLNQYPHSRHRPEGETHLAELNEEAAWEITYQKDTRWVYLDFIQTYPQSIHVTEAYQKITEVEDRHDWDQAQKVRTLSAFLEYRRKHPTGQFIENAQAEIARLREGDEAERQRIQQETQRTEAEKKQLAEEKVEQETVSFLEGLRKEALERRREQLKKQEQYKQEETKNRQKQSDFLNYFTTVFSSIGLFLFLISVWLTGYRSGFTFVMTDARIEIDSAKTAHNNEDYKTAFQLLNKHKYAPEFDNVSAYYLGRMYFSGQGVEQNSLEAIKWYLKAAHGGNTDAMLKLGYYYESENEFGRKKPVEAIKWYHMAAEQGNTEAMFRLGRMYEFGLGIMANPVEAIKWYRNGAERGNVAAQCYLGDMYESGTGMKSKNLNEAVRWYRLAAKQGEPTAKGKLEKLGYSQ